MIRYRWALCKEEAFCAKLVQLDSAHLPPDVSPAEPWSQQLPSFRRLGICADPGHDHRHQICDACNSLRCELTNGLGRRTIRAPTLINLVSRRLATLGDGRH